MPQPEQITRLSASLRAAYQQAQEALEAELASIEANPAQWRRQSRLRELQRSVQRMTDTLDAQAADWLSTEFPTAYSLGAQVVNLAEFSWTQADCFAITQLAQETFDELLDATRHVDDATKRLVRKLGKSESLLKLTTGRTATQAGRDLRRLLERSGVSTITYANGARHGIGDYADMLLRTTTARAYNAGTLNFGSRTGVRYYEISDGADCGWAYHDDTDKANRSIRSAEEVATYSLSHPRCRRAPFPRPEIRTPQDAREAKSLITDEQQADQTATERTRVEAQRRRAQSRRRVEARRAARERVAT